MSVWVLEGFSTEERGENAIRHREYTASARTAGLFDRVPRVDFSGSGHGIVFRAQRHHGRRLPVRRMEHVRREMARLRGEASS